MNRAFAMNLQGFVGDGGVDVQCDCDVGVAEQVGDGLDVDAGGEGLKGGAMTKVVQSDWWLARVAGQPLEGD